MTGKEKKLQGVTTSSLTGGLGFSEWLRQNYKGLIIPGLVVLLMFYVNVVTAFYARQFYFPPDEEIHHSSGTFIYSRGGRNAASPGLLHNRKKTFFSCSPGGNYCEIDKDYYRLFEKKKVSSQMLVFKSWVGKKAEVSWFKQKTDFFFTPKRVVEIVIDGKVMISKDDVKKSILRERHHWKRDIYFFFLCLLIMFFVIFGTMKMIIALQPDEK